MSENDAPVAQSSELEQLRDEARAAGIAVDGRWSISRLRDEIARTRTEPPASPKLAPASESGDPTIHQLLAERQTAQMNGNDEGVQRATDALAELGFA